MSTEKIYAVRFRQYTNCLQDTVSNTKSDDHLMEDLKDTKYLNVGKDPFLIRESEFEKYKEFGDGFESLTYVGQLCEEL